MATTIILEAIAKVNADPAQKSIATLEQELEFLKERFKGLAVGDKEFSKIGNRIREVQSELKTLDERFEGLGVEQKGAAIVDSFNLIAGTIGAVTGALVAFGIESEALEGVEKRLLGIITVVTSLREVSNGLAAFNKIWPALTANIGKATIAIRAFALANPFTTLLIAVTAVTAAVAALVLATNDATEAEQKLATERANNLGNEADYADLQVRIAKARGDDAVAIKKQEIASRELRIEQLEASIEAEKDGKKRIELLKERRKLTQDQKVAVIELGKLESDTAKKEQEDAKKAAEEQRKKNIELRNARLELEGIRQLIRQAGDELGNSILNQPINPGSILDLRNLKDVNVSLDELSKYLTDLNPILDELQDGVEGLGDDLKFLTFPEDLLKRLSGQVPKTELDKALAQRKEQFDAEFKALEGNLFRQKQLQEEYEKDIAKLKKQAAIKTTQDVLGITSQFLNTIAQINQQNLELQLLQAAGNQQAIDEINQKAFEQQKKLRIAQTIVTTAESVLNAFNATSNIPPPFGQLLGAALAASYIALGAKTISTISGTQYGGGSSISSGGGGLGGFSLTGGNVANVGNPQFGGLPGLGGGRAISAPGIGTIAQEPIRAYVIAGDVENGLGATAALNARRRLSSG